MINERTMDGRRRRNINLIILKIICHAKETKQINRVRESEADRKSVKS